MDLSPLWVTLKTAGSATLLVLLFGPVAAWLAGRLDRRLRRWVDSLLLLPMVLPPTVIGYLLLLLLGRNGPIGEVLSRVGIQIVFSWPATVIAAFVVAFPLMYRTAAGAFAQLPPDIVDAARTLGVTEWRVFLRVGIPNAWPGLLSGLVLSFARAMGEFGATMMLAGNIPGKTQTLSMAIFFAAEGGKRTQAAIWTGLVLLLSLGGMLVMTGKESRRHI